MSADAAGNPYIATYWRSSDSDVPQYRLVWYDGQAWHNRRVTDRKTPFTLKGGGTKMIPIARPRIVVEAGETYYIFRDEERGSRVSVAHTKDVATGEWAITDLTDFPVSISSASDGSLSPGSNSPFSIFSFNRFTICLYIGIILSGFMLLFFSILLLPRHNALCYMIIHYITFIIQCL